MSELTPQQHELLADPVTGQVAPRVLWRPIRRLAGSVDRVTAGVTSCLQHGDRTQWSVVWVTNRALVFGTASKSLRGELWSASSEDQSCENITVWSRGLDHIQSIEAAQLSVRPDSEDSTGWAWTEGYQVRFVDGTVLDLPLFNSQADGHDAASAPALAVLDALVAQLDAPRGK